MIAESSFELRETQAKRIVKVGASSQEQTRPLASFLIELGKRAPFDTGWMPPGLRWWRQVGDTAMAVIVCDPGINLIRWGERESERNKPMFLVAQPYRVVIAQYLEGEFRGARMFYSPVPVTSPEQVLYHANLPNTNCLGYNGTMVGWQCLYHNQPVGHESIGGKLFNVINRCSGQEPYNNANMRSTHGPKLYAEADKPVYTYQPDMWEEKTQHDKLDWVFDDQLWIPVKVTSRDEQEKHDPNGVELTIRDAFEGQARYYYHDDTRSSVHRFFGAGETERLYPSVVIESFSRAPTVGQDSSGSTGIAVLCDNCEQYKDKAACGFIDGIWLCADCVEIGNCDLCGANIPTDDLIDYTYEDKVHRLTCPPCCNDKVELCSHCTIAMLPEQVKTFEGRPYCTHHLPAKPSVIANATNATNSGG